MREWPWWKRAWSITLKFAVYRSSQINSKTVLITGGAGSIGSEIVRQIINFSPYKIIILDQAESPLHNLKLEISEFDGEVKIKTVIADVRDFDAITCVFEKYKPD